MGSPSSPNDTIVGFWDAALCSMRLPMTKAVPPFGMSVS